MTKDEQIEEIATVISNHSNKYNWNLFEFECENLAIALHNLGYRKIDDDCAVIMKAELKQYKAQSVKEFAEKLKSRKFDKDMFNDWAGATYVVLVRDIDELLKEYK